MILEKGQAELDLLWKAYFKGKSDESRNDLVEAYYPLVKYLAERLKTKLPDHIDVNDLISAGILGLIKAIEAFEPSRNIKFETYCSFRIRGGMLDDLRSLDWVPRQVRARSNKLERAYQSLKVKLQREPTDNELAEQLGMTPKEFEACSLDARSIGMVSLNDTIQNDGGKELRRIEIVDNKKGVDPFTKLQIKEIKEVVTKGMSDKEQLIIVLYYYDEMTMKEIAEILDMSESRVCQMHASIIERLQKRFAGREDELVA